MPELPEIRTSSLMVNNVCAGRVFAGVIRKSGVNKNPEISFSAKQYTIQAESRGKEMALTLDDKLSACPGGGHTRIRILFHFGMSGRFQFTTPEDIHKHAHLMFSTDESPPHVLSFVDVRRFGTWRVLEGDELWPAERSPDPLAEYGEFRNNVLGNLKSRVFDKPICEVMLNQAYFNGIGNYLRCEILHRAGVPPFERARDVLETLQPLRDEKTPKGKKCTPPDVLQLCRDISQEVMDLKGGGIYDPDGSEDKYRTFLAWLRCYTRPGSLNVRDHNGRTMWYTGPLGKLAPKVKKSVGKATLTKPPARDVALATGKDATKASRQSAESGTSRRRRQPTSSKDGTVVNARKEAIGRKAAVVKKSAKKSPVKTTAAQTRAKRKPSAVRRSSTAVKRNPKGGKR